jgi:hypothetical protein
MNLTYTFKGFQALHELKKFYDEHASHIEDPYERGNEAVDPFGGGMVPPYLNPSTQWEAPQTSSDRTSQVLRPSIECSTDSPVSPQQPLDQMIADEDPAHDMCGGVNPTTSSDAGPRNQNE